MSPRRKALLHRRQLAQTKGFIWVRLTQEHAAYLEDLLADERWHLVKEMKESRDSEGRDDPVQLSEVRLAERILENVRGSMDEVGWRD